MEKNRSISNTPRFFGGHFDSVKQGAIRDFLAHNVAKDSVLTLKLQVNEQLRTLYTARLRLDILLSGDVVITDAQFFDGCFFQYLADSNNDFLELFNPEKLQTRPLEIRLRPEGLIGMINHPFIFSGLSSDIIKKEIYKTMEGVLTKHGPFSSPKQAFTAYLHATDPGIKGEFSEMADRILGLHCKSSHWLYEKSAVGEKRILSRRLAIRDIAYKIPYGENPDADEVLKIIDNEIKGNWMRSVMWEAVNKFRNKKENIENPKKDDVIEQTWAWVLKLYNRALAYQHDCNCIDEGEDIIFSRTDTKADDEYRKKVLEPIYRNVLEGISISLGEEIAKESWLEFFKRINYDPIKTARANWRNALVNSIGMPSKKQSVYLLPFLIKFVTAIRESYDRIGNTGQIIKSGIIMVSETITSLIAGGGYPDIFFAPGLVLGGISIPVIGLIAVGLSVSTAIPLFDIAKNVIGNPIEEYNLIRVGLKFKNQGLFT